MPVSITDIMITRPHMSQTGIPRWDQMTQYASFTLRPTEPRTKPSFRNPWSVWEVKGWGTTWDLSPRSSWGLEEKHKDQGTCLWNTIQVFGIRKGSGKISEEFGGEGTKLGFHSRKEDWPQMGNICKKRVESSAPLPPEAAATVAKVLHDVPRSGR